MKQKTLAAGQVTVTNSTMGIQEKEGTCPVCGQTHTQMKQEERKYVGKYK
jgi:C4-type Zn-finger protein